MTPGDLLEWAFAIGLIIIVAMGLFTAGAALFFGIRDAL